MNIFVILRIAIGCMFVLSGFSKLVGPYQNFLYVIQSYQFFSPLTEEIVARVAPWVEFFMGVFMILGLWISITLRGVMVLFVSFIFILSQALLRQLPVTECGCFGEKLSLPLPAMILLDSISLIISLALFYNLNKTSALSLDQYYSKSE